ncbi:flagellar export protein FliJ [Ramlibacter sp. H39-3-26]|uniref:flagellar export protein FliJ n=1 Tax=Curvibacter soli TaxID=3031331 RepID=UPI0023DB6FF3|nr:flagellar export protein FliJ [Ramlibacter sp. H39-3-26]MDF1484216.1 flagellar export protein FliJ [Ramlibacter sp. H39-3-26]
MNDQNRFFGLSRLVDLREREVDRLQADLAGKRAMRDRYRTNIERIEQMAHESGASGSLPLALSANCGDYKQAMLDMADSHRQDLGAHEAETATAQHALAAAARRKEVLGLVLAQRQKDAQQASAVRQRKQDDDLASQVWWRGRK